MAFNQEDLDQLNDDILKMSRGQRVTQFASADGSVQYAQLSLDQMIALRDRVQREVVGAARGPGRGVIRLVTSKGL